MRALIVLGGGLFPDGKMPPWAWLRVERAVREWGTSRYSRVIVSGRGPVPEIRTEARALADAMIGLGVPSSVVYQEPLSASTLENAFFCRVVHADPLGIGEMTVVTNEFHRPRTELVFRHVFGADYRVDVVATDTDDTTLDPAVHRLLRVCDDEQTRFLTAELLPRITAGDLRGYHSYIFDKEIGALAGLWRTYRAGNPVYRRAWEQLSAVMRGQALPSA
ncbi:MULTISPECIES: YdcF family protein [unclassified Nocardia]|uniref:YdcF family protein n=1 Tax=unclassified Nocardia TaxID=2637762 RepID=UPI001CE3E4D4|nr:MULTISPECIES: YdcF family protein [unclassified Nocardia]